MSITQQGRMMSISTPLGEDHLLINKLSANEALSELFKFEIELLRNDEGANLPPVKVEDILGHVVAIGVYQRDGTTRVFNGMVNSFSVGERDNRFSYYYATVVPNVWVLTQKSNSRIFQHVSVPDILKKIFQNFEVRYELQGTFEKRNYCVQYRETDFDFASRLMEEEGIFYFFEHTADKHVMVVANTPQSHKNCPTKYQVPFFWDVSSQEDFISSIIQWRVDYKIQSGKVTLWDSQFGLTHKHLEAEKPLRSDIKPQSMKSFEVYDYPGGYAKRFDDIDKGGGEQASELQKIFTDNQRTASLRMQEIDAGYQIATGLSDCSSLTAGFSFELKEHPNQEFNIKHTLISVTHEIEQTPDYITEEQVSNSYRNSFHCIPEKVPFRPPRITPKPVVRGSQTAFVVGVSGEEITTDKYGRVKVQFQWDREGKSDADSSCWVRVGQSWASKGWGAMFVPRIGMEVIVDFLEGDPDQPIITGCVYNAEAMPPYKLPDHKTKSTVKTYSSPGGGGFNEFRFEDKKGKEQIFIHGEKDIDTRIKNDSMEWIGRNRNLIVVTDQLEKVGGDKHLQVLGDKNEKVEGTVSLNVTQNIQEKVGQNYALDAGMEIHLKAGMNVTIEAGATLTLKVGGSFININSGGIFIKGSMVMINSGGTAGSGAGSNPEKPLNPKEADKAEPGQKPPLPPPAPPLPVFSYSAGAMVLKEAAKRGTPFCEICAK